MSTRSTAVHAPLAAFDLGSNSFRLEIGELLDGQYRRVDYLKETVRLGAGLDAQGLLTEEAVRRALDCLKRFALRLRGFDPQRVRAVATQTLREARNRDAFLERAQAAVGLPIEVISGREEARLIYCGVAHLQPSTRPRLVIDIGGRSTEMILGRGLVPSVAESFQVGSVNLSMRWFGDGRLTARAFRAAQVAAGAELEEATQVFTPQRWQEALGSSGTVGAVSGLLEASGISDGTITPDGLRWCMERCIEAGRIDRLALPGLRDDRRPVIAGGLSLLYTLLVQFGIERLAPARGALRQGVIIDLDARLSPRQREAVPDLREASVQALQRRFGADAGQAARVAAWALRLYDALGGEASHDGHDDERRELRWACALHEVGLTVSHHDHHRHSAYLVSNADMAGFSQSQQRRIGQLVLGQRGGLRKVQEALQREGFARQLLALRLAAILCHARHDVPPRGVRLRGDGRFARLALPPQWTDTQPRTLHLLREEAAQWAAQPSWRLVLDD